MSIPENYLYTENHEWVFVEGSEAIVGITKYAQSEMGDIVFVELPEIGTQFIQFERFAVVESVKAVSDIYIPLSCTIIEVNENLYNQPELINHDPYQEGWIAKIDISDDEELSNLMDSVEYYQYFGEV